MKKYIGEYMDYLEANHYSSSSRAGYRSMLYIFAEWLKDKSVCDIKDITESLLTQYQGYLKERQNQFGRKETVNRQRQHLARLKAFFEYLKDRCLVLVNFADNLKSFRYQKYLPRRILTEEEAQLLLSKPDTNTILGLRNRTILELFYATGMRRIEVTHLRQSHIDFKEQTIEIRNSKAAKDRMIPVSGRALEWLNKYLSDARPKLCSDKSQDFVFLNYDGAPLNVNNLGYWVLKKYFKAAGLEHMGVCHVFRHTFATQMLEAGVDLRLIQEMLGHTKLETTQIYTKVSIRKLQDVHERTHPAKPMGMSKRYWEEVSSLKSSLLAEEE